MSEPTTDDGGSRVPITRSATPAPPRRSPSATTADRRRAPLARGPASAARRSLRRAPAAGRRRRAAAAHPAHLHARVADAVGVPRRHDVRAGALEPHRAALLGQPPGRLQPRPGRAARAARRSRRRSPAATEQLQLLGVQRPVINYNGTWSAGIGRFGSRQPSRSTASSGSSTRASPPRMITDVGGETVMVFGIPLPEVGAYFEFFALDRGRPHAVATWPCRCCWPA